MTDKVIGKRKQMENSGNTNYIGDISCSSKEFDVENVDAIKKYIEEQQQEILLNQSTSTNDLNNTVNKITLIAEDIVHDCDLNTDIEKQKEKMVLSPSNNKSFLNDFGETKSSEELKKIPSQMRILNNYISEVENEENLIHKVNATLPQHKNFTEQNLLENKIPLFIREPFNKSVVDIMPEFKKQDLIEAPKDLHNIIKISSETKCTELRPVEEESKNSILEHSISKQQLKNKLESGETKEVSNLLKYSYEAEVECNKTFFLRESDCNEAPRLLHQLLTATNTLENEIKKSEELRRGNKNATSSVETLAIASSVMDMILSDAEAAISKKKVRNVLSKQLLSPEKVNISSVSLAIGSKVEAKDFSEMWYPAQIIEVDCEEMEVLVEYDKQPKKHNEWISISSPRLRPITDGVPNAVQPTAPLPVDCQECVPEKKVEEKPKTIFAVGERCLARWRDNRRFIATIHNNLNNGNYEVMFDDGFLWKCPLSRLYKLKESSKHEFPCLEGGPAAPGPAPPAACAPAAAAPNGARVPIYHTHLFDPTRDYLGSKSERREMKRKLNIKEIFNIGQKRKKLGKESKTSTCKVQSGEVKTEINRGTAPLASNPPPGINVTLESNHLRKKKAMIRKRTFMRKKIKLKIKSANDLPFKHEAKNDIPDAVASIIGTSCKSEPPINEIQMESTATETKDSNANEIKHEDVTFEEVPIATDSILSSDGQKTSQLTAEIKTEPDTEANVKEEVIDKIKEVITKLEDGIKEEKENNSKPVIDEPVAAEEPKPPSNMAVVKEKRKKSSKVKKSKKLKLLQEKKVKKEVAKVKWQLEEMKRQVESMRQEMMLKTEELAGARGELLPGEWACRWRDGEPEGRVSELRAEPRRDASPLTTPLPRRSVQVEDYRLPPGWTKHMVRRSFGHSAGKWDVVLVSPDDRRFHTKNDMRVYLENNRDATLKPFEAALLDFGVHLKLSRRLGWVRSGEGDAPPPAPAPAPAPAPSPLLPRQRKTRRELKVKIARMLTSDACADSASEVANSGAHPSPITEEEATLDGANIKDGFVHVGSLKVQVIETLLRCPADGCFKNFRNTMLLKMHIKHYHRDLRKMMGVTPKVLDLAYARTKPTEADMKRLKCEAQSRIIKVKLPRIHRRAEQHAAPEPAAAPEPVAAPEPAAAPERAAAPDPPAPAPEPPATPPAPSQNSLAEPLDALVPKSTKRPRVLLPVRKPDSEPESVASSDPPPCIEAESESEPEPERWAAARPASADGALLDFEEGISSYTVARRAAAAAAAGRGASDDGWGSEGDSRSSRSGSPADDDLLHALSSDSTDDKHNMYMFTENGERIKLVHMKREEIINCHCGFREEDGLMVQCELCLCWQHALCHNIQREIDVPEKYTCSICLNPRLGRRRQRFTHDQDRLYEGLLPAGAGAGAGAGGGAGGGRAAEPLRRAHELAGNLLRAADALHAVRVNAHVAAKKNHPKLYLWAKDWETVELTFAQEKLNSEYSDLSIIINNLGKENLPIKAEDVKVEPKMEPSGVLAEKVIKKEKQSESPPLLPGILSSPGGVSLDLPISESEIEKLAKSVQVAVATAEAARRAAPQPEAAIEDGACRARLLRHVQRCHALLDQRLDSIEAQVAELESQDPSLEDDETADYYPRTKHTVNMMLRDLDAMEELGILT